MFKTRRKSTQSLQNELESIPETVKIQLDNKTLIFDDGKWKTDKNEVDEDVSILRKQKQQLIEENNYLKLKIEILLNMLAESVAKGNLPRFSM
ncbi:Protein chibby-like protein, partial [Stegodyphus mimosarum]